MLLPSIAVLPYRPSLGNSGERGRIHLCQGPLGVIGKSLSQDTEVRSLCCRDQPVHFMPI